MTRGEFAKLREGSRVRVAWGLRGETKSATVQTCTLSLLDPDKAVRVGVATDSGGWLVVDVAKCEALSQPSGVVKCAR